MNPLILSMVVLTVILYVISGLLWLFFNHGIDKLKHPEEWQTVGDSGERIIYNMLVKKFGVPEKQILRNVYIPRKGGKTSEIDLLVISRKGLLVFECKNYGGNIYGDARRQKWIQYIGRKKNYFYNPIMQNRGHAKYLRAYLGDEFLDVPIIPMVATITRGHWKVKNLRPEDFFLGVNCRFKDVYGSLPDSELTMSRFSELMLLMKSLSRPGDEVKAKHVERVRKT